MSISKASLKNLRDAYLNKYVIIVLRDMNVIMPTPDGEGIQTSVMMEGYVVNIDTDFFYIGMEDGTVTKTIAHDAGPVVELMQQAVEDYGSLFPEDEMDGNVH